MLSKINFHLNCNERAIVTPPCKRCVQPREVVVVEVINEQILDQRAALIKTKNSEFIELEQDSMRLILIK